MNSLVLNRHPLAIGGAAAMLAGCGGSQPPIGTPGAIAHGSGYRSAASPASSGDLLYVAANGNSYILTYPKADLVGTIKGGAVGACSDSAGDVFLTQGLSVNEYAHGATSPSRSLTVPNESVGCAVDPTTGNLAVTYFWTSGSDVAIFKAASSTPTLYGAPVDASYCGYDNHGDLFVDGTSRSFSLGLAELAQSKSSFIVLSTPESISGNEGSVQWDGTSMTVQVGVSSGRETMRIYRFSVSGSSASIIGVTHFSGIRRASGPSWILGNRVIVPFGRQDIILNDLGFWKYPRGKAPVSTFKNAVRTQMNAITVSVGTSH